MMATGSAAAGNRGTGNYHFMILGKNAQGEKVEFQETGTLPYSTSYLTANAKYIARIMQKDLQVIQNSCIAKYKLRCIVCGKVPSKIEFNLSIHPDTNMMASIFSPALCSKPYCQRNSGTREVRKMARDKSGPFGLVTQRNCRNCDLAGANLKLCGRCKTAHYCSAACQKQDWKLHKHFCKQKQKKAEKDA